MLVQAKDESKSRGLREGDNPNQSLFNKHFVLISGKKKQFS